MNRFSLFLLFFSILSINTLKVKPHTFIIIGNPLNVNTLSVNTLNVKSDSVSWYKQSIKFIKTIKQLMQKKYRDGELEFRETIEVFPNLSSEKEFNDYYKCYNINMISYALLTKIKERTDDSPVNLYCFGQGGIVLALTLLNIINNYSELSSNISSDVYGVNLPTLVKSRSEDSVTTQFSSDDLSTIEDLDNSIETTSDLSDPNCWGEQYLELTKIMNEIKILQQKNKGNPNLKLVVKATVAVCGVVTLVVTSVVAPVIIFVIAL